MVGGCHRICATSLPLAVMAKAQKLRPEQIIKPLWDLADEARRIAQQYADGQRPAVASLYLTGGAVERTHRRVRVQSSPDIFVGAVETGARKLFDAQARACGRNLCFRGEFGPPNVHLSSSPKTVRKRCEYV